MESPRSTQHKIPVVDMGAIGVGKDEERADPKEWQRVSHELYEALSGVGFVYLTNHGIPEAQISNIVKASAEFFKLDRETKLRYNVPDLGTAHGYMEVDREKLDPEGKFTELRESFYMKDVAGAFPDQEAPHLRPAAAAFTTSCKTLAYHVLTALALGLGLDKDFFVGTHRGMCTDSPPNATVLRVNHYPPLPANLPENIIRCGEHTDFGSITLLFQDSMGGLQVRNMDGKWVDAHPIPGTILVNAGDLLQVWTSNRVVATEHRVIIPTEETRQRASRFSTAFFVHPDNDVLLQPLNAPPTSADPPITARQHLLNMYSKTYTY